MKYQNTFEMLRNIYVEANKSAKGSIEIQYEAYYKHGIYGLYHNLIKIIHSYFLQLFFLKIYLHVKYTLLFTSPPCIIIMKTAALNNICSKYMLMMDMVQITVQDVSSSVQLNELF